MENFDAEQPMEDLQEQTPKKEPKNPLYDSYSLLHDIVYILAAITIVFVFFVRLGRRGRTVHDADAAGRRLCGAAEQSVYGRSRAGRRHRRAQGEL